jgi:hypothetical protein
MIEVFGRISIKKILIIFKIFSLLIYLMLTCDTKIIWLKVVSFQELLHQKMD